MARKRNRRQGKATPRPAPATVPAEPEPPSREPAENAGLPVSARPRGPARRLVWVLAAAALAAVLAAAGLVTVRPGEIVLVPAGDGTVAAVWAEGWHWRLGGRGDLRRLPREPIALSQDVEVRTPEGAAITLELSGSFGIAAGGERDWAAAAGWLPFADALAALAADRLAAPVREADPADLFLAEKEDRLAALLAAALGQAGVRAEGLALRVPVERNPVATAVVRGRIARLAAPTGKKVMVVGWDGADWLMMRPLLEAGRLPNLERLVARGAAGDLRSQMPLLSPLIWTTIATGRSVPDHGIADFLVEDPATGALVPISSSHRKVHALWTLLGAFGLRSDTLAWWATWPAETVRGTMITDRVAYQLFEVQDTSDEGKVYPPSAWERIQPLLVAAEQVPFEEVRRYVDVPLEELARRWDALPADRRQEDPVNHLRKILATTASYHAIALDLLRDQADLTLVYYEGTDTVGHLFARYLPPRMRTVEQRDVERYGEALPRFYEHADRLLGELLAAADDDTVVLMISDHGFFTGEARPTADPADFAEGAAQWHRLHGAIVAAGPGVGRGEITGASVLDVAPTVLALLGLPVAGDMPGRVLPEVVPAGASAPRDRLASYEILPRERPRTAERSEMDEERLRELVALGYISPAVLERRRTAGGDGAETRRPAGRDGAAPAAAGGDLQAGATEAYNLGRILQREGRLEEAAEQFRRAVERSPEFGVGWSALAQVESLGGRHSRAFDLLVGGFGKSLSMPMSAVTGLVDEAQRAGRLDDAARALAAIPAPYRATSAYPAALGLLAEERGRPDEALGHYRRALEVDPLDQLATEQTVATLRRQGREGEARAFLDSRLELAEGRVDALNFLAVVSLRHGWAPQAERILRRLLASDPGNPGVLANLAISLTRQGRHGEAIEAMRAAVEREPGNAQNLFNFGAMLAEQGRAEEALEVFERAAAQGLRSARLHVALAKMRFRLGDPAGAERELEVALALDPGDPEAKGMLQSLRGG